MRAVPIHALGWRAHHIEKGGDLPTLIVSPRRVAGLSNPYVGVRAML